MTQKTVFDPKPLLGDADPQPVGTLRDAGRSRYFLTCDHAGRAVPEQLAGLGIASAELNRHIGWDVGALGVAKVMSERLDAALIWQRFSRLVIDCNRRPEVPASIPEISDGTPIPANRQLSAAAIAARQTEIFWPYQNAISKALDRRPQAALICVHSFTPEFDGWSRPWQLSLMYGRQPLLSELFARAAAADTDSQWQALTVGVNQPYQVDADEDYGIPVHGDRRGIPCLQFEIRQDLIAEPAGQRLWGERLARWLARAEPLLD